MFTLSTLCFTSNGPEYNEYNIKNLIKSRSAQTALFYGNRKMKLDSARIHDKMHMHECALIEVIKEFGYWCKT